MIRYLYLLLIIGTGWLNCAGQIIGGNGEGFFTTFTHADIDALKVIAQSGPIAIRWPGGGDSKVAFPALNKPGLGMEVDSITRLYEAFPTGEGLIKIEAMNKDLRQAEKDQLSSESDLLKLIQLAHGIPNIQISYALNVMQGTVNSNLSAIKTLVDSGVNIITIVAGNETFASYNYDWNRYVEDFEPILKACEKQFPTIPRLLCVGQAIQRKQHQQWNAQLFTYVKSHGSFISGVDIHYYLADELKEANRLHPGIVEIHEGKSNDKLENAFTNYITSYRTQDNLSVLANYLQVNLPDKIYHCSEFGDKQAENWSNTIANGAHIFTTFCSNRANFDILLMHNLLGNWWWAARRPVSKLDISNGDDPKINRIPWFALALANELPLNAIQLKSATAIQNPGIYYYYFDCAGDSKQNWHLPISDKLRATYEVHYVQGQFTYSSAGAAGFWAKTTSPFNEVPGIKVEKSEPELTLPQNSFGYVKVIVE